jgi:uncharacterized membrane protein
MREIPFTIVRGFCMGAADVVPGVSGGTVALVLGIYHRLITAVQTGSIALGRFAKLDLKGGIASCARSNGPSSSRWWAASAWPCSASPN